MSKLTDLRGHAFFVSVALIAACGGGATDSQQPSSTAAGSPSTMAAPSTTAAPSTMAAPTTAAPSAGKPATTTSPGAAGMTAAGGTAGKSGSGATTTAMSPAGAAGAAGATFSAVYAALFDQTAAPGCFGCHGGISNPALNGTFAMVNSKDAAYSGLVGAMSGEAGMCKGMTRVKAGDPMSSLLYLKIASKPPCGMEMPPGGMVDAATVTLVKDWIAAGAKND